MTTKKTKKTKAPKKRTPKRARRRSTDRTASIGAKLLAKFKAIDVGGLAKDWKIRVRDGVTWGDVVAVAGSVVVQDEVKGARK